MGAPVRYISYSLFTRRGAEPGRWYDPFESRYRDRYWFNVPALVVANALFYPGAVMRVHVDPQTAGHPMFPMLARLAERGLVELLTFPRPYHRTEPTLWRMAPVFGDDYDAVLCRDIDSLPCSREAQATIAFLASDFLVQSMRTHPHHNDWPTRMLAGLCGFRCGIKPHLFGTFDDYYGLAYDGWGTDQSALSHYFIDRQGPRFVKEHFLDTCIHVFAGQMCEYVAGHDAGKLPQEVYDGVDLAHVPAEARACLDALTTWPGQPVNAIGETTRVMLDAPGEVSRAMRDVVIGDAETRAFYQL
jgi:hypothetical protein